MKRKLFFSLNKIKKKLRVLSGTEEHTCLSVEETKRIAKDTGLSVREVGEMESRVREVESALENLIETREMGYRRDMLTKVFHKLSEREQEIITVGHLQEDIVTLIELSQTYDVSSERIRQIEARALEKIRECCVP